MIKRSQKNCCSSFFALPGTGNTYFRQKIKGLRNKYFILCIYKNQIEICQQKARLAVSETGFNLFLKNHFFFPFGANIASILRPSILGIFSNMPTSPSRSANLSSNNCPLSWNWIARPLNCT